MVAAMRLAKPTIDIPAGTRVEVIRQYVEGFPYGRALRVRVPGTCRWADIAESR